MLYLTEILGLPVFDSAGKRAGTVSELAASLGAQPPRVAVIVLSRSKSTERRGVLIEEVANFSDDRIALNIPESGIRVFQPDESLFLLRYDLLDQQIIDVSGRKVVRVNDVALDAQATNYHVELLLSEVDIGVRGGLRRLLRGAVPRAFLRKLEARLQPAVIPWKYVNLIEPDPLRRVKLNISHTLLSKLHPADLADIVEDLSRDERQALFSGLDDVTAADALSEVEPRLQVSIVESMDAARAADIMEEMSPDAAADLLGDLPKETSDELLEDMDLQDAEELGELLEFPENSAGGLMTTEFAALPSTADVQAARSYVVQNADLPESFNVIFLVDEGDRLAGSVPLWKLIVASPEEKLIELKSEPLLSLPSDASQEEIVELFDKYNLLSLAIVDADQRLVGIVTVDDVVSLLRRSG